MDAAAHSFLLWTMVVLASSKVLEVKQGEEVSVQCPVQEPSGAPEFWIHPSGRRLPVPTDEGRYIASGTNLTIQNAQKGDAGRFTCISRSGEQVTYGAVQVDVKPGGAPYWQQHATNLTLAVIAAIVFVLACGGLFLVHQYRYERRHKSDVMNGDGFGGAHTNPALDVEAETHL